MSCLDVRMCAHTCTYCKKQTKKWKETRKQKNTHATFSFFLLFYERYFPRACRVAPPSKCGISLPPCSHIVNFRCSIHYPQQFSSRLCTKSVSVDRENFVCFCFCLPRTYKHTHLHTVRTHTHMGTREKQIMMKKKQVFVTVTTGRSVAKTKTKTKNRVPPEPFSIFVAIYYVDSKTLMMQIGSQFLTAISCIVLDDRVLQSVLALNGGFCCFRCSKSDVK